MDYKTNLYWAIRNANKNGDVFEGDEQPHEDEAERLTECYNALSGIPDPAAFVAAAREVVAYHQGPVTFGAHLELALRRLGEVMGK